MLGIGNGTFAEYATARADKLVARPATLPVEQAAAIAVSATTALQAVRDHGRVQAGQTVLVIGASGGVGTFAVQIAKAFGAEVTGVCSTGKLDLVRVPRRRPRRRLHPGRRHGDGRGATTSSSTSAATGRCARSAGCSRRTGTLVIVGGEDGGRLARRRAPAPGGVLLSPFVGQHLRIFVASENAADLAELTELISPGR